MNSLNVAFNYPYTTKDGKTSGLLLKYWSYWADGKYFSGSFTHH